MAKFRTAYNFRGIHHFSRTGSSTYHDLHLRHTADGNMYLEVGKKHDRQAEINSFKASCDVNQMIRRYENGDNLALCRSNAGCYVNLSDVPQNHHEAFRLSRDLEMSYSNLAGELKDKYPTFNDFSKVFTDIEKLNGYLKYKSSKVKSSLKEESVNA